ncbi:MAG TPA: erythromycin esterase family protein [Chthonomonadaceae bacterium]|nr:erythromycin esterase family protein [Chthonomonadaceae bacterium]
MAEVTSLREQILGIPSTEGVEALAEEVREIALPLERPRDLDPLLEQIGDARFVLLGEATHGTSEFYLWRQEISERLISEKDFSFIAVEGDWPDCYRVNRYVKALPDAGDSAYDVLHAFNRWPTWMWANREVITLAEWLRKHNARLPEHKRVGFYGLDVYSLWDSMRAVIGYLERMDPQAAEHARRSYGCFEPYAEDAQDYAWATLFVPDSCQEEAIAILAELRRRMPDYPQDGRESGFNAEQNALIVQNAETYYRTMVRGGAESWNVRDRHMVETLNRLMRFHGPDARAIVWEHNTHIGDARFTDMAREGMVNVGQLVREEHEQEGAVLVGFGTHRGTVMAGSAWEAPMQRMAVPPARAGSWEDVLHVAGPSDKLLLMPEAQARTRCLEPRGHRAIGVVYDPARERYGNYVPTVLPRRYDAFLYFEETRAVFPLHIEEAAEEAPETYPYNV